MFAEHLQAGGVQTALMRVVSALMVTGWKISLGEREKRVAELGRGGNTSSNSAHVSF